ncbi:RloB domain-containing protein [bacterium]|nr:RloB domain-containing protein [bacterium]
MSKTRKLGKHYQRISKTRTIKPTILVVCQGKETEMNYFKGMKNIERLSNVKIRFKSVDPCGMIRHIVKKKDSEKYDELWCVFDIDNTDRINVNQAITLAKNENIHIVYSNESFELWYILHFEYLNTEISRKRYPGKLDIYLGKKYEKNDPNMYQILNDRQKIAITNSTNLLKKYERFDPFGNNPSTTVHRVVVELLKHK